MKIAILTATYNHPLNLNELYETLKKQDDKEFTWIIIDDGSKEDTSKIVSKMIEQNSINIYYEKKQNGGKSSAINRGLELSNDYDFVVIIDDDELLCSDAISIIKKYYIKYKSTDCGIINFARAYRDGTPILKMDEEGDFFASVLEFKRKGYKYDGYVGYFVKKLENKRFPILNGEKYIGPSVLMMLVGYKFSTLWTHTILGTTEYLEGGITRMGRMLRVKNPKGMIYHASLYIKPESGLLTRLAYSIRAYAYMHYAGLTKKDLMIENIDMSVFYSVSFLGKMLALKWINNFT